MFVIAKNSGKQFKLEKGKTVDLDFMSKDVGNRVVFDDLVLCFDGLKIADPSSVKVEGRIVENGKGKKIISFKKQRRTSCFEKRRGFRPIYTRVLIDTLDFS